MGYSYYVSYIVFGFYDDAHKDGLILDREYVEEYEGVRTYAGEINKNYNIYRIIGIQCSMDADGRSYYSDDEYENLMLLKKDYETYNGKSVELAYHAVISGDYEEEEETYRLDDEDDDE